MKRIKLIAGAVLSVLVLSGCSLVPQSNTGALATFTFSKSLWKSMDGGETWKAQIDGMGKANTTSASVLSFAVNPYDGNNAYFGLKSGGIMETVNGGDTWQFINFQSEKVYGLALDPTDGKTLYASAVWQGTGKIFRTDDDGANWKEIYTSPSSGPLVVSLMIDKKSSNTLYATTSDNAVLKSADAGASWKNIYAASAPVLKVAADAQDVNLLYAITNSGLVLRTRDGGTTFEDITANVGKATKSYGASGSTVLEADPTVAKRVYLAGATGFLVSDDAGENWRSISTLNNAQTFPIKALAINPRDPKEIICGAAQATYRSKDGGNTWTTSQFDNKMIVRTLGYDPSDPSQIYLGFSK
ncbi:MAG: hypothetical protein WC022_02755 [Parcubacteria group bacterium]